MGLPQWRLASRLARREVRRRPGRTLLVFVLVAVPVFGMTVGSVLVRTADAGGDWVTHWWRPGTDIVVEQPLDAAVALSDAIPPDAEVSTVIRADGVPIVAADGTVLRDAVIEDPGSGSPSRSITVTDGRQPQPGEVWLSQPLANRLGVEVGDAVTLTHPAGTWTVAGTGRVETDFDKLFVVMPDLPLEQFVDGVFDRVTLIDLPADASAADIAAAGRGLGEIVERQLDDPRFDPGVSWRGQDGRADSHNGALAWGWVAGAIALAATGIIISAAFATSARRQLVTVGQLSANGAPERLVRRSLALQGCWTGLVGSLVGVVAAAVALFVARSTIEQVKGSVLAPYRFVVFDLVVIVGTGTAAATIAALVPARSASRVPVLAALAGRRPLGVVPRRLVPVGMATFALGVFLLFLGASSEGGGDAAAAAAVLGGVMVLAGMCCCSPLAIDVMSRASARVGRSWRFAGRSLGRTRTRSAAVVTAIAVTAALGAASSTFAMNIDDSSNLLPADALVLQPAVVFEERGPDLAQLRAAPLDAQAREQLASILPAATVHPRRIATWEPPAAEGQFDGEVPIEEVVPVIRESVVIADPATIDLYELNASEREALASEGALLLNAWFVKDCAECGSPRTVDGGRSTEQLVIETASNEIVVPFAMRDHVREAIEHPDDEPEFDGVEGIDVLMITEETARRLGFEVVEFGAIVRNDAPLTSAQLDAVSRTFQGTALAEWYRDADPRASGWWFVDSFSSELAPTAAIQGIVLGAVLVLTLLVVAIGLSLAATESRDERDVLVAVGARPRTMRSLAGSKALVMTLTGVALAIPTGLIPAFAVTRAVDDPFQTPWAALAGLLVAVPLVAGAVAWAASSVAQRFRPVQMSNFSFD
jgi:putative ABC transport system permease protein